MKQSRLITNLLLLVAAKLCMGAESLTRWEWMIRVQEDKETSRVKYCGEHLPSMKSSLEADNQRHKTLLRQVAASFQGHVAALPELAKPVEPKLVEGMAELLVLRAQLLSKSADLQKDCTEVQMGLARETYESLRAEMQQALDKVPVTPDKPGSPQ